MMKTIMMISLIIMVWALIIGFIKVCFFDGYFSEKKDLRKENEKLRSWISYYRRTLKDNGIHDLMGD